MVVTLVFHMRMLKRPTKGLYRVNVPWQQLLWVLYISSALIMTRSLYRVAEYVTGDGSVLKSKESYLYCLDALPMLLVALTYNVYHPSKVLLEDGTDCESLASLDAFGPGV